VRIKHGTFEITDILIIGVITVGGVQYVPPAVKFLAVRD
jgi:hypothetical protein